MFDWQEAQRCYKGENYGTKALATGKSTCGLHEPLIPSDAIVRYLYASGEQEGGRWRATDRNWSLTEHSMRNVVRQGGQPALYYLTEGPARCFVREELLIMPPGTELPPDWVLTRPAAR